MSFSIRTRYAVKNDHRKLDCVQEMNGCVEKSRRYTAPHSTLQDISIRVNVSYVIFYIRLIDSR